MSQNLRAQVVLQLRDRMSRTAGKIRDKMRGLSGTSRTLRRDLNGASDGSNRLGRSLQGTTRQSAKLDRQTHKTAQSQNQLINEFRTLKATSQTLRQRLDQTQNQMAQLARAGKKTGTEFANLKRKAGSLKRELGLQGQRLETTRRKMKAVDVSTSGLAASQRGAKSAIKSTTEALAMQARELKRVERRQQALDRLTARRREQRNRLAGIGAKTTAIGVGGLYAGRQALRPITSSVGQYGSFEERMDSVASVARVKQGSPQYQALTGKARHLGATTSFTAQDVGAGMEFQAMAGFKPDAILATIGDVLDLAKATKTDLGTTSDISSNILSAFGLDPAEMQRVADVLTATTTRSNVNLTMLGESMKYVAPEAKALGISLEETAAMAGLLGNSGIQGSQAGTSLRAIYQRLAAPRAAGQKALKELNIQTKDAQGNLRSVPELLAEIGEATKNMGTGDRKQIFKDLIGMEAGSAFSTLIDEQGFEVFRMLLAELGNVNGEAKRVATEMGDNLPGDIKTLKSAVSEVALTIGEALNPALRDATQFLTRAARSVSSWLKEHPLLTKAIGMFVIAIAGLLIVGGGLLTFLGSAMLLTAGLRFGMFMLGARTVAAGGAFKFFGSVLTSSLKGAGKFLARGSGLSAGFTILRTVGVAALGMLAAASWPVVAALAVVGGAVFALWKYWDRFSSFVIGVGDGLYAAFSPAIEKFSNAWSGAFDTVRNKVGEIATSFGGDAETAKRAFDAMFDFSGISKRLGELKATVTNFFSNLFSREVLSEDQKIEFEIAGGDLGVRIGKGIMNGFDTAADLATKAASMAGDFKTKFDGIDLMKVGSDAIQSLLDGAVQKFGELKAWVQTIPSQIIAAIGNIDLSNMISWPAMPSWLGGGSAPASPAPTDAIPAHAKGGTVARTGPILVGEKGPELRYANKGQFIAHHRQLQQMAALSRAGKRAMAGTVLAASMSGAVAAETAPPMLPQLEASGRSYGGSAPSAGTKGGGGSGAAKTVNNNTFHMTFNVEGGSSPEEQARKIMQIMERQMSKRLTD